MDFSKDDVLPTHTHNFDDAHITIIARGSFEIQSPGREAIILRAGAYLDWPAGTWHEFKALEDNSRLYNIRKIG